MAKKIKILKKEQKRDKHRIKIQIDDRDVYIMSHVELTDEKILEKAERIHNG